MEPLSHRNQDFIVRIYIPVKVSVQLLIPESLFDVPKSDILMTPEEVRAKERRYVLAQFSKLLHMSLYVLRE